jgi:hypothetical protein
MDHLRNLSCNTGITKPACNYFIPINMSLWSINIVRNVSAGLGPAEDSCGY